MDTKKRNEVYDIITAWRGKPYNDGALKSYCERKGYEFVDSGSLQDYIFQQEHDEKMSALYPKVLAELQNLSYIPEYINQDEQKRIREKNDEVRINIAKLFEEYAVDYRMVDASAKEVSRAIALSVEMAGTTIFNKASSVLMHIAKKKFGGNFNAGHAARYAEEVYGVKTSWWERTKNMMQ